VTQGPSRRSTPPGGAPQRRFRAPPPDPGDESWEHVSAWYERLAADGRTDHFERVIAPGAVRLLDPVPGMRILDLACGEGTWCRRLAALGAHATGIDASPSLVAAARAGGAPASPHARRPPGRGREARVVRHAPGTLVFEVGDVRDLAPRSPFLRERAPSGFDAVTCVMALMNISPLFPVLRGVARELAPAGRFVAVILHPAFRCPGRTSWGFDSRAALQYRRIDAYLSPHRAEIVMNPGGVARGARPVLTHTHHRPLGAYVEALARAGLLTDAIEEWPARRRSQPGPRAAAEDRARAEIPLFLALRALRHAS
jgi:SAM-dependent methyltransferase